MAVGTVTTASVSVFLSTHNHFGLAAGGSA
jgi:hypothetical protein